MKKFFFRMIVIFIVLLTVVPLTSFSSKSRTDKSTVMKGYREPLSEGVSNTITNALYMYNTFWTPLSSISAWSTSKKSTRQFIEGHTYRGIPYGQPVHKGAYVGSIAGVEDFVKAVNDPESALYTDRGENTWEYTDHGGDIKYSPYYSNDCSGFVSAALGIKRHTTRDIGGDETLFPRHGSNIYDARPCDFINTHEGGHVIMVLDVIFDEKGGNVITIATIEQTPDIITVRSYGKGGTNGPLSKLQERVDSGGYYLCRYRDIDSVKPMNGALDNLPKIVNAISEPSSLMAVDKACVGNVYVDLTEDSFDLEGFSLVAGDHLKYEYSVDGSEFRQVDLSEVYSELSAPVWGFSYMYPHGEYFTVTVATDGLKEGSNIVVRASVPGSDVTYGVADLTVKDAKEPLKYHVCIDSYNKYSQSPDVIVIDEEDSEITLNGWCMSDSIVRFEIKTDDGLWYQLSQNYRQDVYDAYGRDYPSCVECNGFNCGRDLSGFTSGKHTVSLRAVAADGRTFTIVTVNHEVKGSPYLIIALMIIAVALIVFAYAGIPFIVRSRKLKKKAADTSSETSSETVPDASSDTNAVPEPEAINAEAENLAAEEQATGDKDQEPDPGPEKEEN
ncbi:MAG: hypothetical protein IJS71_03650 [Clostridia bacterium]|nr:hypothetical protein [Clostridia bacterium]